MIDLITLSVYLEKVCFIEEKFLTIQVFLLIEFKKKKHFQNALK